MPISSAALRDQTPGSSYVVSAPRASDPISYALRAAFGHQEEGIDDFTDLLRCIDLADHAKGNC